MFDKGAILDAPNREESGAHRVGENREPPKRPPVRHQERSRADRLLGQTIERRFTLDEQLARGAMGCVFVGRQHPLDRKVAIKVLDPRGKRDDDDVFEERFLREAGVLARLQHPNTVRVYDYGHWKGHTYLVMEHVDGHSLRRLQAGGPMPPSRMLHIGGQICDALQEAHALGLIHRDLKPANVLLTRHAGALDVVKVVDFGLAKDFQGTADITQEGQVLGTPMYMAPEQIRDEAIDQRTDIYALGVLLFRGLTGVTPFEKGKPTQVLVAHLKQVVPRFAEVAPELELPPCVEWTVRTCLRKRAEDRFANVVELKKAIGACMLALEHEHCFDLALDLDMDGRVVLPRDLCEATSFGVVRLKVHVPQRPDIVVPDGVAAMTVGLMVGLCTLLGGLVGFAAGSAW